MRVRGRPDAQTDAAGEITILAPADATSSVSYDDGFGEREIDVRDRFTELVVATIDVAVRTVDGLTGEPVASAGIEVRSRRSGAPEAAEPEICGAVLRSVRTMRRKIGVRIDTAVTPDRAAAGTLSWSRPISITARRVRIDVPLFPLHAFELRPISEAGEEVSTVEFCGSSLLCARRAETDGGFPATSAGRADGALLVSAPRVPANFALFDLESPVDEATNTKLFGTSAPMPLAAPGLPCATEVPVVRVDAGHNRVVSRNLTAGCGCRMSRETTPVKVRVLRRDGSPAPHVLVRGDYDDATTGADGTATVNCTDDVLLVHAAAHGFLLSTRLVKPKKLAPDAVVEIVESEPRRVRIVVVDGDDRPVPSARVFAEYAGYAPVHTIAQMDGDTEIGTPRTDADGVLLLDVCDGNIRYDVSLAGAATTVTSDAAEVRVVLGATPPAQD